LDEFARAALLAYQKVGRVPAGQRFAADIGEDDGKAVRGQPERYRTANSRG
jgi:hypothetical protein